LGPTRQLQSRKEKANGNRRTDTFIFKLEPL
jgi:hypothetical protein